MVQDFTLHTHTIGFDGKNTIQEMAKTAEDNGMEFIGISNHFIVHPQIKNTRFYGFSVSGGYSNIYHDNSDEIYNEFRKHYAELEQVAEQSKIKILKGMELDYFPAQNHSKIIDALNPDFLIGACHFIEYKGHLCNIHDIQRAEPAIQEEMIALYWQKIKEMAHSGIFNWFAHLDLPARVNLGLEDKWEKYELSAIDAIASSGRPVEINTALYKYAERPHPSPRIMKMCADKQIPMFLSDDAHHVSQVCRHFQTAKQYADSFGVKLVKMNKIL
jgi:histidinol-phosphatase (PHP family)